MSASYVCKEYKMVSLLIEWRNVPFSGICVEKLAEGKDSEETKE